MSATVNVIRRVVQHGEEAALRIEPHHEDPAFVHLTTWDDSDSKKQWGVVDLPMTADFAAALGKALIDASMEARNR